MADDKEKNGLEKYEKVMAMVSFALGLASPENEAIWDMEGIDKDDLSDEERELIIKVRKDQWASSIAMILQTLTKAGLMSEERMGGFRHGVAMGVKKGEESNE